MEYILFIHKNTDTPTKEEDWDKYFGLARSSGIFQGGSEIGKRIHIGSREIAATTRSVASYMRFESDDIEVLKDLLHEYPVLKIGGTLELCELSKT